MFGIVRRRVPERHDRIADKLVDHATVGMDSLCHGIEVRGDAAHQLGGRRLLALAREAGNVTEHDGELAVLAAQTRRPAGLHQPTHETLGHVQAEGAYADPHPLHGAGERRDLGNPGRGLNRALEVELAHPIGLRREHLQGSGDARGEQHGADQTERHGGERKADHVEPHLAHRREQHLCRLEQGKHDPAGIGGDAPQGDPIGNVQRSRFEEQSLASREVVDGIPMVGVEGARSAREIRRPLSAGIRQDQPIGAQQDGVIAPALGQASEAARQILEEKVDREHAARLARRSDVTQRERHAGAPLSEGVGLADPEPVGRDCVLEPALPNHRVGLLGRSPGLAPAAVGQGDLLHRDAACHVGLRPVDQDCAIRKPGRADEAVAGTVAMADPSQAWILPQTLGETSTERRRVVERKEVQLGRAA